MRAGAWLRLFTSAPVLLSCCSCCIPVARGAPPAQGAAGPEDRSIVSPPRVGEGPASSHSGAATSAATPSASPQPPPPPRRAPRRPSSGPRLRSTPTDARARHRFGAGVGGGGIGVGAAGVQDVRELVDDARRVRALPSTWGQVREADFRRLIERVDRLHGRGAADWDPRSAQGWSFRAEVQRLRAMHARRKYPALGVTEEGRIRRNALNSEHFRQRYGEEARPGRWKKAQELATSEYAGLSKHNRLMVRWVREAEGDEAKFHAAWRQHRDGKLAKGREPRRIRDARQREERRAAGLGGRPMEPPPPSSAIRLREEGGAGGREGGAARARGGDVVARARTASGRPRRGRGRPPSSSEDEEMGDGATTTTTSQGGSEPSAFPPPSSLPAQTAAPRRSLWTSRAAPSPWADAAAASSSSRPPRRAPRRSTSSANDDDDEAPAMGRGAIWRTSSSSSSPSPSASLRSSPSPSHSSSSSSSSSWAAAASSAAGRGDPRLVEHVRWLDSRTNLQRAKRTLMETVAG